MPRSPIRATARRPCGNSAKASQCCNSRSNTRRPGRKWKWSHGCTATIRASPSPAKRNSHPTRSATQRNGSAANSQKGRSNSASLAISTKRKSSPNCSTPSARCHDAGHCRATSITFARSISPKHLPARPSPTTPKSRKRSRSQFGKLTDCATISPSSADSTSSHQFSAIACAKRFARNSAPPTAPMPAPTDPTRSTTWATSPPKALANRRTSTASSKPCASSPMTSPKMEPPPTSSTAPSNPSSASSKNPCATTATGSTPS